MRVHNRLDNGKPQATARICRRISAAMEAVEELRQIILRDTNPGINDG